MGPSFNVLGAFKIGGFMNTAIHETLWALVSSVANTTMGWAMVAVGPVLALLLAAGVGIAVWREIFESAEEIEEREEWERAEAEGAGSQEGFDRFMATHREDMIDPDDD